MIMQQNKSSFTYDPRYVSALLALVFTLGTLALIALVVALFILCLYILNIALDAVCEVVSTLSHLYTGGDSIVKLVIWLVGLYVLCKLAPWVVVRFRRALHV